MNGDHPEISVYVIFVEEGPAYDAVSQMSAESWGYNVEPPPLPPFLLENAVALLRRPAAGSKAPPEGDLENLDNEDPAVHPGLLVRFMRFSPEVDRLNEMLNNFRRNLLYGASPEDLQAVATLRRRGCKVTRAALEYKSSQAHKKRPWAGTGRYRYLLPVIFPEDRDIVEALSHSIQSLNATSDDRSRIRVYSAQMIWNLSAAVTIQTAWRAYRTRKQYREAMRRDLLQFRASKFIRDWVGWQVFLKRLSLCTAIREVCLYHSPDQRDVFLTADLRSSIEAYMRRQPPRVAREQRIQFTIDHEGRAVVVADPRQVRQGLPRWTGLDLPVLTLEEVRAQGLPAPYPLGDISPLLLQGGDLQDVVFRPDKPRPALAPEVRVRYSSAQEAKHRICLLLTLTWHLHERRGIRMLQIPTSVQLLLQAIHPDTAEAKILALTEIYSQEEQRIRDFVASHFGTSPVRPFLEDLLMHGARQKLAQEERKCFQDNPGGLIGAMHIVKPTVAYEPRFTSVREVPLLLDTILENKFRTGFTLRPEASKSIGAAAAPPSMPLPGATLSRNQAPLTLVREGDRVKAESSLLLLPQQPPAEVKGTQHGPREARLEMLLSRAEAAQDLRSARAVWEGLMHLGRTQFLEEKRGKRQSVLMRPRLHPRSLNTGHVVPLSVPEVLTASENAAVLHELREMYTQNARDLVDRERSAHQERIEKIERERESAVQEVHAARQERKERNAKLVATTRDVDLSIKATLAQATRTLHSQQRFAHEKRASNLQVVRHLTNVASLLVKQQRQFEKEEYVENSAEVYRARKQMKDQWRAATRTKREVRREMNRTQRERDLEENTERIGTLRAENARTKMMHTQTVREEEKARTAILLPAGGTMGPNLARKLHIGKRAVHLSTVMSAAEAGDRKRLASTARDLEAQGVHGTEQLRGWSPDSNYHARLSATGPIAPEY